MYRLVIGQHTSAVKCFDHTFESDTAVTTSGMTLLFTVHEAQRK